MRFTNCDQPVTREQARKAWVAMDCEGVKSGALFDLACEQSQAGYVARETIELSTDLTIRHANEE